MRTDELIDILAAAQQRQPHGVAWGGVSVALAGGLAVGLLLMTMTLGFRSDLIAALTEPVVCLKLGFTLVVLLTAGSSARQLSLFGKRWRRGAIILLFAFTGLALWGLIVLSSDQLPNGVLVLSGVTG